jgi:small subunit ribosomal protein S4
MTHKGPRVKLSRRLGIALTPKSEVIMQKRAYAPGQHGQRRRPPHSEFGKQLLEKQRLKFQYNVSERELRRYFRTAKSTKGNTPDILVNLLEHRLDNVVRRAGFAPTIYAARQLVSHKHITVNGKTVNKPNFRVGAQDVVGLREKSKGLDVINNSLGNAVIPSYIEVSRNEKTVRFIRTPMLSEVPITCEAQLVVEFFSR